MLTKWYMHKLESYQANEMHKILWDFLTQTDHLIPARRAELVIIKKKKKKRTCSIVYFTVPADKTCKNKRKYKERQVLGSCQKNKL